VQPLVGGAAVAALITLLTDFGTRDTYVGQMKGVIFGIAPMATVVDLTHEVTPQRVSEGAFLLETALAAFPPDTIHLAVVDPGVGTARRAIAVATPRAVFVGPDNGLLSAALPEVARPEGEGPVVVPVPEGVTVVELANQAYRRPLVSNTFHGRDVFAPAAAHLATGVPVEALGPRRTSLIALPPFRARRLPDGSLEAEIVSIDRFGNAITTARAQELPAGPFTVTVREHAVAGPVTTYAEAQGPAALVGSSGYLEIAVPNASAAARLGLRLGDRVRIAPRGSR
jgi:S-adenosylmethionine hydrolase